VSSDLTSNLVPDVPVLTDVPVPLEIPPLNYGDLAALGFAHWTPAGLCQWAMELTQVSTGIPWFWTIITVTLATRLIILPLSINSLRLTARLAPHQPRLMELRAQLSATSFSKDPIGVQRISLEQKKIYEQANVSLLQPLLLPFVQLPLSLGMFVGVKKLCDLPLEQLHNSGFSLLQDLVVPDPTYILPIAMAALINVQITVRFWCISIDYRLLIFRLRLAQKI
jgi:YidC/Oxa1 family membrane protein insertase